MSEQNDLLIEIGCEELPPKSLKKLMLAFADNLQQQLQQADIAHGKLQAYAAPRRLAVLIEDVHAKQADKIIERKGPPLKIAYDDNGQATPATLRFAESCGVSVDDLTRVETPKGTWLYAKQHSVGQPLANILPDLLSNALQKLPIRKPMRWGDYDYEFIRPVHWLVILYGEEVIPANLFGKQSAKQSYGHRFHHPQAIDIAHARDYATLLAEQGYVLADFAARQAKIKEQILTLAKPDTVVIDDTLLEQVTAMVEWPVALLADFDADFLNVPAEALISAIREHQSCFHLLDAQQQLLPRFITVSNIASHDPQAIIAGNQRVMRARLADAKFFYHTDCKQPLSVWQDQLKHVIFQQKLGSVHDKTQRVTALAKALAQTLSFDLNASDIQRAGELLKVDLVSDMVGEFPELQGIMGQYYAQHAGENNAVATAIREHYLPRFAGDALPQTDLGTLFALADRLDTLAGIFAIDQKPTGDKDPFALRRAAIAVVRLILDKAWHINLSQVLQHACQTLPSIHPETASDVQSFIVERFSQSQKEQDVRDDRLQAVLACQQDDLLDAQQRLSALHAFLALPAAESLTSANKRVWNLLNKSAGKTVNQQINPDLLQTPEEKSLAHALNQQQQTLSELLAKHAYTEVLQQLAPLREPVDAFFDNVMIMAEDPQLRDNRLALLSQLRALFLHVADLSLLQV